MNKINTYGLQDRDDYDFTLEEFLVKEVGRLFEDIIYVDFDMSVAEFCGEFIEMGEDDGFWVSTI